MQVINSSADLAVISGGDTECSTETMTCEVDPYSWSQDVYVDGYLWLGYSNSDMSDMGFSFDNYYGWY